MGASRASRTSYCHFCCTDFLLVEPIKNRITQVPYNLPLSITCAFLFATIIESLLTFLFSNTRVVDTQHQPPNHSLNDLIVSDNSAKTNVWRHHLIRSAEQSIEISGNFCGGEIFLTLLNTIHYRLSQKPELTVHLIADFLFLGSKEHEALKALTINFPRRFYSLITTPRIELFPSFKLVDNHVKTVIVDEKYFIIGGSNLEDGWKVTGDGRTSETDWKGLFKEARHLIFPKGNRDMDVVGRGPIAKTARLEFFELWRSFAIKLRHPNTWPFFAIDSRQPIARCHHFDYNSDLIEKASLKLTVNDPDVNPRACRREYAHTLKKQGDHLYLAHVLITPHKKIITQIRNLLKRGTKVTILTNGKGGGLLNWFAVQHNRPIYAKITKKGGETSVFEYGRLPVMYHKKVAVLGNNVLIGSYNLSPKSDSSAYEWLLSIESQKVADVVVKLLKQDQKLCMEVPKEELADHKHDLLPQITGFIYEKLA